MSEKKRKAQRKESSAGGGALMKRVRGAKTAIRFCVVFLAALWLFVFVLEREAVQASFVRPHLVQVATLTSGVLNFMGAKSRVLDSTIRSSAVNLDVVEGCESIYPTAMLWAALLAFPATWKAKAAGIVTGAVVLFFLNIVRLLTMYYLGLLFPSLFNAVHVYAWQALFILATLLLYLLWAARASAARKPAGG